MFVFSKIILIFLAMVAKIKTPPIFVPPLNYKKIFTSCGLNINIASFQDEELRDLMFLFTILVHLSGH